jgi:flagellar protein FliS
MQQMIMINTRPQDAYRKQDIMTATPVELIVMLYDALKRNIVMGKRSIEKKNIQNAHKHLMKAQDIVSELINSLDMSYEVSEGLLSLYEYLLRNLQQANIRKDIEPLEPLMDIVEDLRSAWHQVNQTNKGSLYQNEVQS